MAAPLDVPLVRNRASAGALDRSAVRKARVGTAGTSAQDVTVAGVRPRRSQKARYAGTCANWCVKTRWAHASKSNGVVPVRRSAAATSASNDIRASLETGFRGVNAGIGHGLPRAHRMDTH